jgi:hypothetical protein
MYICFNNTKKNVIHNAYTVFAKENVYFYQIIDF